MGRTADRALTAGGVVGDVPPGAAAPRTGTACPGAVPAGLRLARLALVSPRCALGVTAYGDGVLHRVVDLPDGPRAVRVEQRPDGTLTASWGGPPVDPAAVVAPLRRVLALDVDLQPLHDALAGVPAYRWVAAEAGGRALRGATPWEDLLLTPLEARTTLAGAQAMVRRLVQGLGPQGPLGDRGLPDPGAVAAAGEGWLREHGRLGFRAGSVARLADAVLAGAADGLDDPARPDEEVGRRLAALPGIGAAGVGTVLGLLGRPRPVPADRWALERLGAPDGASLAARYARHGRWAGTVAWLDLTRHR